MNKFVLYQEDEHGDFKFHMEGTDEKTQKFFDDAIKNKVVAYSEGMRMIKVRPAYICLCELTDGFDFILGKKRIGNTIIEEKSTKKSM